MAEQNEHNGNLEQEKGEEPNEDSLSTEAVDEASNSTAVLNADKCKQAFQVLWPESDGKIHKTKLLAFFEGILGPLYCEEMTTGLIEIMNPDEEGFITTEGFTHAFALSYWTPESVAAMHDVLLKNPDIISKLADWKGVLKEFGLDMTDEEVSLVMDQAQQRATTLLSNELSKSTESTVDSAEVYRKSGEILNTIRSKLNNLDINTMMPGAGESLTPEKIASIATPHPEEPQFPAVPDKLECEESAQNETTFSQNDP